MTRPNILLFTTDQHRGDCLGLEPDSPVETPNLDGITDAWFPRAHTEIPSTTGARRIMLTGRGSHACGVIGYSMTEWDESLSVASILARSGYHCINVGWRNLHPRRKYYGFHQVVPHELTSEADEYWEWLRSEIGPTAHERDEGIDANGWLAKPWDLDERYHATNWTTAETIRQLERRDPTKPFFLWCSHLRPHSPYDPPRFFWDLYANRRFPVVPRGAWSSQIGATDEDPSAPLDRTAWYGRLGEERLNRMRTGYYGSITHIDYQLGHLIEVLKSMRLWNNTLVLFCSDHGDMLGDHDLLRKCYAYEGSSRIPFAVRYPESIDLPRGSFDDLVGLQDVAPTVLEAAGVPQTDTMTGHSVFDAVRGKPIREWFHGEHSPCYHLNLGMHYLTDGKRKYIWYPVTGIEQLFDLEGDPGEEHDLSSDPAHRRVLEQWRSRLVGVLAKRDDPLTDGTRLLSAEKWYGPDVG